MKVVAPAIVSRPRVVPFPAKSNRLASQERSRLAARVVIVTQLLSLEVRA